MQTNLLAYATGLAFIVGITGIVGVSFFSQSDGWLLAQLAKVFIGCILLSMVGFVLLVSRIRIGGRRG